MNEVSETSNSEESITNDIPQRPIEREMQALLQKDLHLNTDIVYQTLSKNLPIKEIKDKIKADYYKEVGNSMIERITKSLGPNYVPLLIEPSLGSRIDEFLEFAKYEEQLEKLTPWELRNRFKESLGTTKVFRVMTALPNHIEDIKKRGFIANYYRSHDLNEILSNTNPYKSMEHNMTGIRTWVNTHAGPHALTEDSMLISVSEYPKMAQYAAFVQLKPSWKEKKQEGYRLYQTPILIEEFKLIRYGPYIQKMTQPREGVWRDKNTGEEIDYNDKGIEALVEFQIPAGQIDFSQAKYIEAEEIPKFKFTSK